MKFFQDHQGEGRSYKLSTFTPLALSCAGLSFCFFLGFPFANHNESFMWTVYLDQVSLRHAFTHQFGPVATFRPLGLATAWLTYHLAGNIFLQQFVNYLFVMASLVVLYFASGNKVAFAILSFLNGSVFFSGYIFLFHLHGVFYGPFELFLAYLVKVGAGQKQLSSKLFCQLFLLALIISLYHTFAVVIFAFFVAGYLINDRRPFALVSSMTAILICVAWSKLLSPAVHMLPIVEMGRGLITSFRMVEVSWPQSITASLFNVLICLRWANNIKTKLIYAVSTVAVSAALLRSGVPVLLLWVFLCVSQSVMGKNWPLAFLLVGTVLISGFSGTGSPTYAIFSLLTCVFITAGSIQWKPEAAVWHRISYSVTALVAGALVLMNLRVRIPVVFKMVRPILAEKEKTFQLERIIGWMSRSKELTSYNLQFFENAGRPVNTVNSVNRTHRPPTTQAYLDYFIHAGLKAAPANGILYVSFGDQKIHGRTMVYQVEGRYNGSAYIFR